MKKNTKVTISQLLDRAEQRKNAKPEFKKFNVESMNGYVVAQKPSREIIDDSMEREELGDEYCVYQCVVEPNLKDKDLHNAFGVKSPLEIVGKVFEPGEITNLAKKLVGWVGYSNSSVSEVNEVDDIKN